MCFILQTFSFATYWCNNSQTKLLSLDMSLINLANGSSDPLYIAAFIEHSQSSMHLYLYTFHMGWDYRLILQAANM